MAKKSINISVSLGAGVLGTNVLAGKRFENISVPGVLTVAHLGSATGLEAELFVSNRNSLEKSPVPFGSGPIKLPEDIQVDDVECFPGERVQLNVDNPTAGALTYTAKLIFDDSVMFQ